MRICENQILASWHCAVTSFEGFREYCVRIWIFLIIQDSKHRVRWPSVRLDSEYRHTGPIHSIYQILPQLVGNIQASCCIAYCSDPSVSPTPSFPTSNWVDCQGRFPQLDSETLNTCGVIQHCHLGMLFGRWAKSQCIHPAWAMISVRSIRAPWCRASDLLHDTLTLRLLMMTDVNKGDSWRSHSRLFLACGVVILSPFQYGFDFGMIGGLQAMRGFLQVWLHTIDICISCLFDIRYSGIAHLQRLQAGTSRLSDSNSSLH